MGRLVADGDFDDTREDLRSIWEREDLPARWRWDGAKLGAFQTGMGMDEGVSAQLPLPEKSEIE